MMVVLAGGRWTRPQTESGSGKGLAREACKGYINVQNEIRFDI